MAQRFDADVLLGRHLPMLDPVGMPAGDYRATDPADSRRTGLAYTLKVLAQSYTEPQYGQEWCPKADRRDVSWASVPW